MTVLDEVMRSLLYEKKCPDRDKNMTPSFLLYLKVMLIPNEIIFDHVHQKIMHQPQSERMIYSDVVQTFLFEKMQITNQIYHDDNFYKWFSKLSTIELGHIINSFSDDIEKSTLKTQLYLFSIYLVREKIEGWLLRLNHFSKSIADYSLELYTVFFSFQSLLLPFCQTFFFEKKQYEECVIQSFVLTILGWANQISFAVFSSRDMEMDAKKLLRELNEILYLLQRCFYFFNTAESDFDEIAREDVFDDALTKKTVDLLLLSRATFLWLVPDNIAAIVALFKKVYRNKREPNSPSSSSSGFSKASSQIFSMVASVPSFFSKHNVFVAKKSASAPVLTSLHTQDPDVVKQLNDIEEKFTFAETGIDVLKALKVLFHLFQIRTLHQQFASELIAQCWKEHMTRQLLYLSQYAANKQKPIVRHADHDNAVSSFMLNIYCKSDEELACLAL